LKKYRIFRYSPVDGIEYLNMAKAYITRGSTKITVEGTPKEVAELVEKLGSEATATRGGRVSRGKATKAERVQKATPVNLIGSLIDGGFFRKPKDLSSIKVALEEMGHFYPITTLSPTLLRLVRRHQLRRIRDQKRWLYTG
jgi:hypothetical protein